MSEPKTIPLQPVGDRLIVLPDPAAEITKGGLHIPDNAKERPQLGTILRVGEGRGIDNTIIQMLTSLIKGVRFLLTVIATKEWIDEHLPLNEKSVVNYKPGMRVLYGRYAGTEVEYKEVKYLMIRFSDIAAIVED